MFFESVCGSTTPYKQQCYTKPTHTISISPTDGIRSGGMRGIGSKVTALYAKFGAVTRKSGPSPGWVGYI